MLSFDTKLGGDEDEEEGGHGDEDEDEDDDGDELDGADDDDEEDAASDAAFDFNGAAYCSLDSSSC